jgi:hypothetical protein
VSSWAAYPGGGAAAVGRAVISSSMRPVTEVIAPSR